ncbi:MAG: nonribosomal peptide synthetase 4-like, partial [Massilia sp.]|nr:nonribosomal peptide synthetase 4-like [Massilia sp.]
HTTATTDSSDAVLMPPNQELYREDVAVAGYFTYPLILQCFTHDDRFELHMTYDSNVIGETQLRGVSQHIDQAVQMLLQKRTKSASSKAASSKKH